MTNGDSAAMHAIFDTVELLESILLALPLRDLLLAQRVCKDWQKLIESSIRIQRALFLKPVDIEPVSYIDWRLDDKDQYAGKLDLGPPLRGPDGTEKPKVYAAHWGRTRDDQGSVRIFVNPLLKEIFPLLKAEDIYFGERLDHMSLPMNHPFASWQNMLITQPPIHTLSIEREVHQDDDDDADWTIDVVAKKDGYAGMTMSRLFEKLDRDGRSGWIEGRSMWEAGYAGFEDLSRIIVAKKPEK